MTLELIINGKTVDLHAVRINDIIVHYGLEQKVVVVEADGRIIEKEQWTNTELQPGMKIELVHFVGGG